MEDPHARGEATRELSEALEALTDLAESKETTVEIVAQDSRAEAARLRAEGGPASEEPEAVLVGASVTEDHRTRLIAALVATERMDDADLALFRLVRTWDEEAAMAWLGRALRIEEPEDTDGGIWRLVNLAEELENERLTALTEAAAAREEEIEQLWPEDESEETEKLRQEKLAALYQELREGFAEVLAGGR